MKLSYKAQMIICIGLILLANVISTIMQHWIYRSAGFAVCGLLWIIHPVLPKNIETSSKAIWWTRIAGVILILIGVFTRAHIY